MSVLGIKDETAILHERAEIGDVLESSGPIRSLSEAKDFESLIRFYEASLSDLEEMISKTKKDDPKMAYYRSLLILTKKIELELKNSFFYFQNLFRDLEEIHDFVHEIYPA
ncbi:PF11483 family protein [Leptospira weilii serovar Topaz str. LT2116]|uniref:PF11483 family protein n=1 Tax=Leptospira weilii serovar Topaz str. LT2116 TaxID=1088540 RepID=M3H681_9LEPT|nr:PF11483 family protein [Leptospira weilii serovar Topaz str. LT2116]